MTKALVDFLKSSKEEGSRKGYKMYNPWAVNYERDEYIEWLVNGLGYEWDEAERMADIMGY